MCVDPVYVVTGFMRSGTSMMMQCLIAGGLTPIYDPQREQMNQRHGDEYYQPNRHGFYEPSGTQFQDLDFPLGYEGRVFKALRTAAAFLRPLAGGYRFVVMRRDSEEIRQSYRGFFGYDCPDDRLKHYDRFINWIILHLDNRRDVLSYHILDYRDVVENPRPHFTQLYNAGWPICPEKSASAVDPTQYRFRRELLVDGL